MVTILYWPNGDWAFEHEVWKPEPGYRTATVSQYWPDERISDFVHKLIHEPTDSRPINTRGNLK